MRRPWAGYVWSSTGVKSERDIIQYSGPVPAAENATYILPLFLSTEEPSFTFSTCRSQLNSGIEIFTLSEIQRQGSSLSISAINREEYGSVCGQITYQRPWCSNTVISRENAVNAFLSVLFACIMPIACQLAGFIISSGFVHFST